MRTLEAANALITDLEVSIRNKKEIIDTFRYNRALLLKERDLLSEANERLAATIQEKDETIHRQAAQNRHLQDKVTDHEHRTGKKAAELESLREINEVYRQALLSLGCRIDHDLLRNRVRVIGGFAFPFAGIEEVIQEKDAKINDCAEKNATLRRQVKTYERDLIARDEHVEELQGQIVLMQQGNDQLAAMRKKLTDAVIALGYTVTDNMCTGEVKITGNQQEEIEYRLYQTRQQAKGWMDKYLAAQAKVEKLETVMNLQNDVAIQASARRIELEAKIKELEASIEKWRLVPDDKAIKQLEARLAHCQLARDGYKHTKELLEHRVKELEAQIETLNDAASFVDQGYTKQHKEMVAQLQALNEANDILQGANKLFASVHGEYDVKINELQSQVAYWTSKEKARPSVRQMTDRIQELEEALEARIKEVKMLRGFRKKERDEKVEKLEKQVQDLRTKLQLRKAADFGVLYGGRPLRTEEVQANEEYWKAEYRKAAGLDADFGVPFLKGQLNLANQTVKRLEESVDELQNKVRYHKLTAEKRLAAIKLLQHPPEETLAGQLKSAEDSIRNFCKWLEDCVHDSGHRGYRWHGKLQWARKVLEPHFE